MARKTFLEYIFSENNRPLYVNEFGVVQEGDASTFLKPDGQPAYLKFSPQGWRDTLIKYGRNTKYWGVFRDFTVPMKFVGDGATIMRYLMWTHGLEYTSNLGILRLNRLAVPYHYEKYYLSELNLAKYKENLTGVTCEALEGGLLKYLKANENTTYEFKIQDDPFHVNAELDGREFDYNRVFEAVPDQEIRGTNNFYLGMVETSREGNVPDVQFQDILPQVGAVYPNDAWVMSTDRGRDVRIVGDVTIYFNKSVTPILRIETNDGTTGGFPQYNLVAGGGAQPAGSTKTYTFDITITLPANTKINVKVFGGSPTDATTQFTVKSSKMTFDYVYRFVTSYAAGFYPDRLLELIVRKMTDGKYGAASTWLSGKRDLIITSGDALRRIPGAVIKTSLAEFFQSMRTLPKDEAGESAGLAVEDNVLRMERLGYFFREDLIIDLGEVKDPELSIAEDLLGNVVNVGQKPNEYTDVNGREEVNQGQQWTMPITKVIKEIDMVSPYRKDPLGIELLRINFEQKKTTDSSSDNDTFLLNTQAVSSTVEASLYFTAGTGMVAPAWLNIVPTGVMRFTGTVSNNGDKTVATVTPQGDTQLVTFTTAVVSEAAVVATIDFLTNPVYKLNRPAYTVITGVSHPDSMFNVELSPKRSLLGSASLLHSMLPLLDTKVIKMASADKNRELYTELAGVVVDEDADIVVADLTPAIFKPVFIGFTTEVPQTVLASIKLNPYGRVRFKVEGEVFHGFLFDGGIKPATHEAQKWQLLSVPENDFSKFKKPI